MGLSNLRHHSWSHKVLQLLDLKDFSLLSLEERIKKTFKVSSTELRMIMGALLLSAFVIVLFQKKEAVTTSSKNPLQITTLIPSGQVLVPIQLKNFESIDSILGNYGHVDLITSESKLIAKNIKLLRAPKNPSLFAVLAPQAQASEIITANEKGLFAVIKNDSSSGTVFVKEKGHSSRITYIAEDEK